jgi:tetratricopeptide (TPR) repeat protein
LVGQAKVLCNVGLVLAATGRATEARQHLAEAASLARQVADRHLEATVQHNLGYAHACEGRYFEAQRNYLQALLIRDNIGDIEGKASSLEKIGTLLYDMGNPADAARYWESALITFDEIAHPRATEIRSRLAATHIFVPGRGSVVNDQSADDVSLGRHTVADDIAEAPPYGVK